MGSRVLKLGPRLLPFARRSGDPVTCTGWPEPRASPTMQFGSRVQEGRAASSWETISRPVLLLTEFAIMSTLPASHAWRSCSSVWASCSASDNSSSLAAEDRREDDRGPALLVGASLSTRRVRGVPARDAGTELVVFDYHGEPRPRSARWGTRHLGFTDSLPDTYGLGAHALSELLNTVRAGGE